MSGALAGLVASLILLFSDDAMLAATQAAEIFARSVMPALFPMLVLGALCGARNSERFMTTVAFAFLSGTPASSQRVRRILGAGVAKTSRMAALMAATGVMSPLFFTGSIAAWTGDAKAAWVALLSHWAGALLCAAACGFMGRLARAGRAAPRARDARSPMSAGCADEEELRANGRFHEQNPAFDSKTTVRADSASPRVPLLRALPAALQASAQALLAVCAAMMLFSIVASLLQALCSRLSPALAANDSPWLAVAHAALEVGGGCAHMARLGMPMPLLCAMCGFGGLSLWLQALLFVGDIIRPAKLLAIRALHGAISYAVCSTVLALL